MPGTKIELQIREQDGSVVETFEIGDREPAREIETRLMPLARDYAGTGYAAVLLISGLPEALVGSFS